MELKDYLHLLRRQWKLSLLVSVIAFLGLLVFNLKKPLQKFQAHAEVLFKDTWTESPRVWIGPLDNVSRIQLMTSDPVLTLLQKDLERLKNPLTLPEIIARLDITPTEAKNVLRISATAYSLETAVQIRDRFLHVYRNYETEEKLRQTHYELKSNQASIAHVDSELAMMEGLLQKVYEESFASKGIVDVETQARIAAQILSQFEGNRQKTLMDIQGVNFEIGKAGKKVADARTWFLLRDILNRVSGFPFPDEFLSKLADPELIRERKELRKQLEEFRATRAEKHPDVLALRRKMTSLAEKIEASCITYNQAEVQRLQEEKKAHLVTVEEMGKLIQKKYDGLKEINDSRDDVAKYQMQMEQLRKRRLVLEQECEERKRHLAGIGAEIATLITIIRQSKTALSTPGHRSTLAFAIGVALFTGVAVAFLKEFLDPSISSQNDVNRHLNLSTLAMVPFQPGPEEQRLLLSSAVKSPLAELYAQLALPLMNTAAEKGTHSLLVTSAAPNEGKSLISSNVAVALSRVGYRVALVDGDLRKSVIHEIFGLDNSRGMTQILSGEAEAQQELVQGLERNQVSSGDIPTGVEDYLHAVAPNLWVLPAGISPSNPLECLNSRFLKSTIDSLSQSVDIVIVDSPPMMPVADATVLARVCDHSIMIVAEGLTSKAAARRVKKLLEQSTAPALGVVLNKMRQSSPETYYYYYSGYYRQEPEKRTQ